MTPSLADQALKHLRYLVNTIGPRPAGSRQLQRAQQYIENLLVEWGYDVIRQPISCGRRRLPGLLLPAASLVLIISSWLVDTLPGLVIWLPVLGPLIPQVSRWWFGVQPGQQASENLLAWSKTGEHKPRLLLTAHLDTAPALPFRNPLLIRIQRQALFIYQRLALGLGFLAVFRLLGISLLPELWTGVGIFYTLVGGWLLVSGLWLVFHRNQVYSPGAHDNASGAAVLLAAAEYFQGDSFQHIQLGFGFLDGEETGLDGSRTLAETLDPGQDQVINLDMVGAGECLRYVDRDGTLYRLKTDRSLNQRIQEVYPPATPLQMSRRSGDYRPFLVKGIAAASLETTGSEAARTAYHTDRDDLDVIDPRSLQLTAETVIGVVRSLNETSS